MATIELRPDSHGKVRDIYDCGDSLLMVASDRISAFDFILPDEIPHKGEILTRISAFWFDRFSDLMPNHMISLDVADFPNLPTMAEMGWLIGPHPLSPLVMMRFCQQTCRSPKALGLLRNHRHTELRMELASLLRAGLPTLVPRSSARPFP